MNVAKFQFWWILAVLVSSCNSQSPGDSRTENSVQLPIPSLSGPDEWTADRTSKLTLLIRERLFGVWMTTEMHLPLGGSLKLDSDGGVLGILSGDLRQIRSDEKRRDEYLLGEVFTSEANGAFSCSTQTIPTSEIPEILPFFLSGRCTIMGITNPVSFQIESLSYSQADLIIRGSAKLSLDVFGVPDISQEPVVKVARQVEARFLIRFIDGNGD